MDYKQIIESLLFISGEPLTTEKIAAIIGKKEKETESILEEMRNDFFHHHRGLCLLNIENQWQLTTIKEAAPFINKLQKITFEGDLTSSAIETLAIIGYKGPLTRGEINEIRGVESSYILRQLLLRGLIERKVHPQRGSTYLYYLSGECLKFLGVSRVTELIDYQNLHD